MARVSSFWKKIGDTIEPVFAGGVNILIRGTNRYLNFGSEEGADGYGFRDNGGTIEYKSSGGSWEAIGSGGGGTPGGSDTQVQFNDGGVFAGSDKFAFNKTTGRITHLAQDGSGSSFRSIFLGTPTGNNSGNYSVTIAGLRDNAANVASGSGAIAIGANARASGNNSVALGGGFGATGGAYATNAKTVAIGERSEASEAGAVTIGSDSTASGENSVVIGAISNATGNTATALGRNSNANHNYSTVVGGNTNTSKANQIMMGKDNDFAAHTLAFPGRYAVFGSDSEDTTAILKLDSTTKGFLLPSMTEAQRDAITTPTTGLQVYNTTTNEINFYDGTSWGAVGGGGGGTPGGADTQVQFNDGGVFAGSDKLAFNKTTGQLTMKGAGTDAAVTIGQPGTNTKGADSVSIIPRSGNINQAATGNSSIAIGMNAQASTNGSVAIGGIGFSSAGAAATGDLGVAVGSDSAASGPRAVAVGQGATVAGTQSVAVGGTTSVSGTESVGLGYFSRFTANYAGGFGARADADFDYSFAIGYSTSTTEAGQIRLGRGRHTDPTQAQKSLNVPLQHVVLGTTDDTTNANYLTPVTPDASAILQLEATPSGGSGFLLPRVTTTERDAITTPATGLQVYNTTTNKINFYNSTAWEAVGGGINAQTGTAYTLALSDVSNTVTMTNASANTLTVPPNASAAFPIGTRLMIRQRGVGATTIGAGAGVTINVPTSSSLAINEQFGSRGLEKMGTNEWDLI